MPETFDHISKTVKDDRTGNEPRKTRKMARFYISTPVGKYNPNWAIAFYEGMVKHIYFVAETKGDMSSLELRDIKKAKAHCAREHFRAISCENIKYDVVDIYDALWNMVRN